MPGNCPEKFIKPQFHIGQILWVLLKLINLYQFAEHSAQGGRDGNLETTGVRFRADVSLAFMVEVGVAANCFPGEGIFE